MHDRLTDHKGGTRVIIRGVTRAFEGGVVVFEGLDLRIEPGDFVAILGPSGCGKSTLLRLIAGLDKPQAGEILIESGAPAAHHDRRAEIAYVFQDAHLLPWRNVLANVALPLELMGIPSDERDAAARDVIEQVGLGEAIHRYPSQLSGGMRMRASLARALVTHPKLLLLDEPFAALDELTRQRLDEQLRRLWSRLHITVLFVTHSTTEAAFLAERAIVLSRRPARIVLDREITLTERDQEVRTSPQFMRETQILFKALHVEEDAVE